MNIKINKPILFALSIFFCFGLYWPSMNGTPIWDDYFFLFQDPTMKSDFSYFTVWKNYGWPMSVSVQKIFFNLFYHNYFLYHLASFFVHVLNSLLVYKLARTLKRNYSFFIYLCFLLHPTDVISVSWIIQFKTVLCFFFAISSLLCLEKGIQQKRFFILSWILFASAVLSKSSAIPLAAVFILFSVKKLKGKEYFFLIPFLLISVYGSWRLFKSPVTQQTSKTVKLDHEITVDPKKDQHPETIMAPRPMAEQNSLKDEKNSQTDFSFSLKTLYYYFWQVPLPIENAPVKGLYYGGIGIQEIVHVLFLVLLFIIFWKQAPFYYLLTAHMILAPFYGITPAPFMNITWVSDQHLYLALPPLLLFWFALLDKLSWKKVWVLPTLYVIFFSYKTGNATNLYKNDIVFYESSLEYNPLNVPISYNLAFSYLIQNNWNEAHNVISTAYYLGIQEPIVRQNAYYPYIVYLYQQMQNVADKRK